MNAYNLKSNSTEGFLMKDKHFPIPLYTQKHQVKGCVCEREITSISKHKLRGGAPAWPHPSAPPPT